MRWDAYWVEQANSFLQCIWCLYVFFCCGINIRSATAAVHKLAHGLAVPRLNLRLPCKNILFWDLLRVSKDGWEHMERAHAQNKTYIGAESLYSPTLGNDCSFFSSSQKKKTCGRNLDLMNRRYKGQTRINYRYYWSDRDTVLPRVDCLE